MERRTKLNEEQDKRTQSLCSYLEYLDHISLRLSIVHSNVREFYRRNINESGLDGCSTLPWLVLEEYLT